MKRVTKFEVSLICITLTVVFVLAFGFLRRQAHTRRLAQCTANMKVISHSFHRWFEDVEVNRPPWRISTNDGGNKDFSNQAVRGQAWFQFATFSNQLLFPSVLVDPADRRRGLQRARTWVEFADPKFQSNACSYGLAPDDWESRPRFMFSTLDRPDIQVLDRHVAKGTESTKCASSIPRIIAYTPSEITWTDDLHGSDAGNAGFTDGSVRYLSSTLLRHELSDEIDWNDNKVHFLFPDQ